MISQFDVYRNPSRNTRAAFPPIVDVQNCAVSGIATRIVIPSGVAAHFNNEKLQGLTPEQSYQDEKLLLLTSQVSSLPANLLETLMVSLIHFRDDIIAAPGFAIAGFKRLQHRRGFFVRWLYLLCCSLYSPINAVKTEADCPAFHRLPGHLMRYRFPNQLCLSIETSILE